MRNVGTVVRGIRTGVIKEGDNLIETVINSVLKASESEGFKIKDRDIIGITEAVVAISDGNYANIDQIALDVKSKYPDGTVGLIFPTPVSRNRFSLILKGIARGSKKIKMNISRIGYIKTITLGLQEATLFKNNAFDDNEILHADEYLVSYYKLVKINKINVNCWKKYSTNNNDFIISFDLNTLVDEDQNVDYNYTISYIKSCNKYIEENQIVNLF